MDEDKQWLTKLADEVNEYLIQYGYGPKMPHTLRQFCELVGLTTRQLKGIRQYEYLYFMPTEVYARLNWILGIESADPTKVPKKVIFSPHGGVLKVSERAWTTSEYNRWIGSQKDTDVITNVTLDSDFGEYAALVGDLEPALYMLERLLRKVIDTGDVTLWDKLAIRFQDVFPNVFALMSALTLDGDNRNFAIAMLNLEGNS